MSKKYLIEIKILTSGFCNLNGRLAIHKNNNISLRKLYYEQQKEDKNGPKIIDIKDFVFEQLLEERNDCKCCFLFLKQCNFNNNYYEEIKGIDDKYFKQTGLYQQKDEITIYIRNGEACTCHNLAEYKKTLETKKKQEKEIEELKKTLEEEKKKREEEKKKAEEDKKKAEEEKKKTEEEYKKAEEERRQRENNRFREINNSLRRQLEFLSKKIEEGKKKEKEKKEKKKIIKGKVINDFLINLPKVVDDCFHKNFRKMVSNFLKEINKLFDEKISFEQISKDLIKEIPEEENFALNKKNILENEINSISYNDEISKINHFNILIMGRSGVGKSTLLNKVLKKEVAKTKEFDYCTKDIESYESEKVSGLRLWDTRGIEYKYNISDVFKDISEKIKALINEKDPDKYIHCIWFCIKGEKGERLNKEIQDIINNCHNLYNIQKLPIILVFTNSYSTEESMEFIDFARREFQKFDNLNNVKFVRVLAKDKETDILTIPANGIYNLMEQTFDSVKIGMQSSLIESLTQKGKEFINRKLQKIINNIDCKENLDVAPLSNYNNDNISSDSAEFIFDDDEPNEENYNSFYNNNQKNKPKKKNNNNNNYQQNRQLKVNNNNYYPQNKPLQNNTNWFDNDFYDYGNINNNQNKPFKILDNDFYDYGNINNNQNKPLQNKNILFDFDFYEEENINNNQYFDNNTPQTPEEFDIDNLPIKLGKIKYNFESFKTNLKNNCEEITVKLLNTNKITNKKLFSKIFNVLENIVIIVNENFEEIYQIKGKEIYYLLKDSLYIMLINTCTTNGIDKSKSKKIYDKEDLEMFGKNIADNYFKNRIESKIYEEIEQKILEGYAEIFKKNLLSYFDELIIKNKIISNIFTKQGEENANIIFNKIRSPICYENDDLALLLKKKDKIGNKSTKKEDDIFEHNNKEKNKNNINNDNDEGYEIGVEEI